MFASGKAASASAANYIEDVFSTYLYDGNGSTQTITNGVNLSTYGGLVWSKSRSNIENNVLLDTIRGPNNILVSNSTAAGSTSGTPYVTATTTGYSIGTANNQINVSGQTYVSWTFRKQPKFFDVVTYTGTGSARTVAHNLGSAPGCIIVKRTDTTGSWAVYHQARGQNFYTFLNTTAAEAASATYWNNTAPTSTEFTVGTNTNVNASGGTYVAYIFAHDAGGFGLTGTDNVISCGSFTGAATVNLGWEPQFILYKTVNVANDWKLVDNTRGLVVDNGSGSGDKVLKPNLTNAELGDYVIDPTSTGFIGYESVSNTHIYIAIRRGPMKVPTSGTSVFSPIAANNAQGTQNTTGFPVDLQLTRIRNTVTDTWDMDRLRGVSTTTTNAEKYLNTDTTGAEGTGASLTQFWGNTGFQTANGFASASTIYWNFGRAPSFFDEVCYTGTGSARTVTHNLGVAPEMMIIKNRSVAGRYWAVYSANRGVANALALNQTSAEFSGTSSWNGTAPTSSVFTVNTHTSVNESGATYVAYLFATCAGVSKVGSYTGNGSSQTINCGFTSGARFVLIKATSTTGNWGVFDTARGITSGNDPCLRLNTTAAEDSGPYVGPDSTGFTVGTDWVFNESGVTYIFLAIA